MEIVLSFFLALKGMNSDTFLHFVAEAEMSKLLYKETAIENKQMSSRR